MNYICQKSTYRIRYERVIENLSEIATFNPKEKYMFQLMDTVIFYDFETALDVVLEDYKNAQNDNNKLGGRNEL